MGGGNARRMRVMKPGSVVVAVLKRPVRVRLCVFVTESKNQDAASLQQRCGSGLCLHGLSEPQQVHRAGNSVSRELLLFCLGNRTEPNRPSRFPRFFALAERMSVEPPKLRVTVLFTCRRARPARDSHVTPICLMFS